MRLFISQIPWVSTPWRALRRLNKLTERIASVTNIENGTAPTLDNKILNISLFSHRRNRTIPMADVREIEAELADIINSINSKDSCLWGYTARFFIVFDEMDKIDPALMDQPTRSEMPEYTEGVKGFPDGMDSRARRRSVLKLLANIKLFVGSAHAKFIFISGRELYDAFLADLSDRDFAISSIFTGVINADSFLSPEGGQTDVRSMSEWYIANRLLPKYYLEQKEKKHKAAGAEKEERPSLKWYYEYLIRECRVRSEEATYVVGFLHTFASYLTHISNGSPKKIYLYFEKYLRRASDCVTSIDWGDICSVGIQKTKVSKKTESDYKFVLYFDTVQQQTINFVNYLAGPIMKTITNDLSSYGDRFLVSLSFIIDHIYKHHSRSFSWRNMEQIPDLLKTSKAPELRDAVSSIMEYLTQIHVSKIIIGLNEYKFHKSIAEEISMISKQSEEASAIFNFTLDESISVIQHNTRLLDYYTNLSQRGEQGLESIISRIHSNLGDLRYWDEDYYTACLEYRAAIETLPKGEANDPKSFLTKLRCMLKMALTYEMRKLYPNTYQLLCDTVEAVIRVRWIEPEKFGLEMVDNFVDDWREKRQMLMHTHHFGPYKTHFEEQFGTPLYGENDSTDYSVNVDGVISSFSHDLTPEKAHAIGTLTLFEEVRYVYQAILAKLSVIEKIGMSGITQTNIDVAEGEFRMIHKSVNLREKFIISADFFNKLAEILYYKNSLTILTQNQDALYASVYYGDYDLLAYLDDYCAYRYKTSTQATRPDAAQIKYDVRTFFNWLNNETATGDPHAPQFLYSQIDPTGKRKTVTFRRLFETLKEHLDDYLKGQEELEENNSRRIITSYTPRDDKYTSRLEAIKKNVLGYLNFNIDTVFTNRTEHFAFGTLDYCDEHRRLMRTRGLRPPCYACKYYTRSLRILSSNMFDDKEILHGRATKAFGLLRYSFKEKLLYTGEIHLRTLAKTLDGFGNVMYSCTTGDSCEREKYRSYCGINSNVLQMMFELTQAKPTSEHKTISKTEEEIINKFERIILEEGKNLSRLDKSLLYYWDAYRFYLIGACWGEAVECLKKIVTIFTYYIEEVCYSQHDPQNAPERAIKEAAAIKVLVGDKEAKSSLLSELFRLIARHTSYKYDNINLSEINDLKWIYSKEFTDNVNLTQLSTYPDLRATWLRVVESRAKGIKYLSKHNRSAYTLDDYRAHLCATYHFIAPKRRYTTTFYEEVLGYYTKVRYNDHVLNDILGSNPLLDRSNGSYLPTFHINFYQVLADYLLSESDPKRLDKRIFGTSNSASDRLALVEFLIIDTLVCITNMIKVFTPHNHLTSFSKSFIGIVYNFYWEWARKYELLYSLYQYHEAIFKFYEEERDKDIMDNDGDKTSAKELNREWKEKAEKILNGIAGGIRQGDKKTNRANLKEQMTRCCHIIDTIYPDASYELDIAKKFGRRSDRFYATLRHDIDDITISTIFSNYTAEMALRYFRLSYEVNTEGEAYNEMMGALHFLNDDFANDTCQFNIACDRFLLGTGVVERCINNLEEFYKLSHIHDIDRAYINGTTDLMHEHLESIADKHFARTPWINSEFTTEINKS